MLPSTFSRHVSHVAEVLNGKKLTYGVKAGEPGRLYGSVSDEDIVQTIQANYEIELEKHETGETATPADDPWKLWIINIDAGSDFEKEESQNEYAFNSEIEIEKVTGAWKTNFELSYETEKENLVAILLDTKLRPKGYHLVALGSLNECTAHPREIFRPVIVHNSFAFILAHNHPSGVPQPSEADRRLTAKLRDGADLLQINFIDHVIIGSHAPSHLPFYSFRNAGLL